MMNTPLLASAFALLQSTLADELERDLLAQCTSNLLVKDAAELRNTLVQVLDQWGAQVPVLVFSDGVRKASGVGAFSADDLVQDLLAQSGVSFEVIHLCDLLRCQPSEVHASVEAVAALQEFLSQRAPAPVLVVGSGSVTDIVKHALQLQNWVGVPFVVLPTALTVTAFTSHFAVLEESGAKRTRISRRVDSCVWFVPVLASAPIEMTRAGYGDLLARFVAYGDWYLGWKLGVAARYDELAFRLMEPFSFLLRRHAAALVQWPVASDAIADLSAILAMAGMAMSVSGETTPLSGYEHTISHALDYLRLTTGRPLAWHGQQVALGSLVSAESFAHLLNLETVPVGLQRPLGEERIKKTIFNLLQTAPYFGAGEMSLSPEERKSGLEPLQAGISHACELFTEDYLKKHTLWLAAQVQISNFEQDWLRIRAHLQTLVITPTEMQSLLELSGLPLVPEELSQ